MYILRKRARKLKKSLFLHFMTISAILLFEEEPVELNVWLSSFWKLEINYVRMYVWFNNSQIKNLENIHCKKYNSKCTKFRTKTPRPDIKSVIRPTTYLLSKQLLTLHLHLVPNQSFRDLLNAWKIHLVFRVLGNWF